MKEVVSNNHQELKKIDVISFLKDFIRGVRRLWLIVLVLTLASTALSYFHVRTSYTPTYVAEATVSVEIVNGGTYANQGTAEQMGLIFPYILTSGALSDVIAADLGTTGVPGSIQVNSISGTNLLTISVTSNDPTNAYDVLQSMLKNYPEVAQYVVGQTELTVIDDSGVPEDSGRTAVVRGSIRKGAVTGFAIGILLVLWHMFRFRTIRNENELRSLVNVNCLGTLPACKKKARRQSDQTEINILYDIKRGDYIEAMRLVRTRLERQMEDKQILMVTSSIAGEGKSTVAANLAISMALKGKKVILVDCDLRNPSVGKIFRLKESYPGLAAVINGEAELDQALCVIQDEKLPEGLTLLPGADQESRLVEILGSEGMKGLLDALRERADIVILDTPPSAMLVDAVMLVKHVDAVAYVVMSDFARRRYIFNGVEELAASGAPLAGCILNGGPVRSGKYGYYGYHSRYGTDSKDAAEQSADSGKTSVQ